MKIEFIPAEKPEQNIKIEGNVDIWRALDLFLITFRMAYGPFPPETELDAVGDVLEHLGQALKLAAEGDNPAVIVRSVMGDEESNFTIMVSQEPHAG